MKIRNRFFMVLCLFVLTTFFTINLAQAQETKKDTALVQPANLWLTNFVNSLNPASWSVSASFGSMLFYGDLRQYDWFPMSNKYLNDKLIKDKDKYVATKYKVEKAGTDKMSDRKWGGAFSVNKQIGPILAIQGQYVIGKVGAASYKLGEKNIPYMSHYFEASFSELALNAQVNLNKFLFPYQPSGRLSFYLTGGIGLNTFKSSLKDLKTGNKYNEKTFVESSVPYITQVIEEKKTTETVFPVGFGFKYHITPRISAFFETTLRNVNSDKMDSWSVTNSNKDKYQYTCIGISYSFGDVVDSLLQSKLKPKYKLQKKAREEKSKLEAKVDSLEKVLGEFGKRLGSLEYGVKAINDSVKAIADRIVISDKGLNTMSITTSEAIQQLLVVFFDFNSIKIKPQYMQNIAIVAKIMKNDPKVKVQIVGHADKKGSDKYNMELSKKRAQIVHNVLVSDFGISAERLSNMVYKGKSDPLSSTLDDVNRRVDFIFSK
ncbi:MAG: OmpA family protein [Bacteroidales bacterium]|nr:OmpA family protein [Bacteroidales bacterium]